MVLLATALMAALLPEAGQAEADGPDYFRVIGVANDDALNMRAAPDADAQKVGQIAPDANGIRNLGCEGGLSFAEWQAATDAEREAAQLDRWCRVSFGGVEGWVAARFLGEGRAPAPEEAASEPREPSVWRVVTLDGRPVTGDPEIRLAPDGAISGGTGCNRFQARGRMDGGRLVIDGPVAVSRMACPGGLDAQESRILSVLQGTIAVAFDPLTERLELSNGGVRLGLRRAGAPTDTGSPDRSFAPPAEDEAEYLSVYGVEGHLNIRAEAGTGSDVVARVLPGTLLRNFRCIEGQVRRWCEVEVLDGSQARGWAAADYLEPADSALRAGREVFDAIGHLPCAQARGQPMDRCEFGVARDGGGSATIVVIRPDTTRRALFFRDGSFLSADTAQADGYPETSATREGDLTVVRVGAERYEIPDAVLFGG